MMLLNSITVNILEIGIGTPKLFTIFNTLICPRNLKERNNSVGLDQTTPEGVVWAQLFKALLA